MQNIVRASYILSSVRITMQSRPWKLSEAHLSESQLEEMLYDTSNQYVSTSFSIEKDSN